MRGSIQRRYGMNNISEKSLAQQTRSAVQFVSEDRTLRGWLYLPEGLAPYPAIVVTSGFGCVKEMFADHDYPAVFAAAGFAVLVYDHPFTGESEGEPRQEIDPVAQQRAYQDAITFLSARSEIDAARIGIWGTSYSGGHVLAVAAVDRRVRCVVSQVMTISGSLNLLRRHAPSEIAGIREQWARDRIARLRGDPPALVTARPAAETRAFFESMAPECLVNFKQEVTSRSYEWYYSYEPAQTIERISPTPLLMIVCSHDTRTPPEDALAAFHRARKPKKLVLLDGGHYDAYRKHFGATSQGARDWFVAHLSAPG